MSVPRPEAWDVPRGAVDAHVHVFDPARFPFDTQASYHPLAAECGTAEDLARVLDAHGVDRVVLVNPTAGYGEDTRCLVDALARLGDRARGVARLPLDAPPAEFERLAHAGVVGVRLDFVGGGLAALDDPCFPAFLAALADRDWVLDVQAQGDQWARVAPALATVPVRVAIDHLGRPDPSQGVDAPGFVAMLRLAERPQVAVKLSGLDRFSLREPPHADALPYAAQVVRTFGSGRLLWGSDWPFVRAPRRADYGPLLAALPVLLPHDFMRREALVDTPARWFGFPPT